MQLGKRIAFAAGLALLVASSMQLLAPKAVHSTVAALVSVVGNVAVTNPLNSSGTPQPFLTQDAEAKAYQAFRQTITCSFDMAFTCTNPQVHVTGTQMLVINDISGLCQLPAGGFILQSRFILQGAISSVDTSFGPPPVSYVFASDPSPGSYNGLVNYTFGRQTYIVLDSTYSALYGYLLVTPPSSPDSGSGTGKTGDSCTVTFSGYYVHL